MKIQSVSKRLVLLFSVSILFFFSLSGCFQRPEEEVDKGTIVILNGTSSTGKSSISNILKNQYYFKVIELDEYFPNEMADWLERQVLEKEDGKIIEIPREDVRNEITRYFEESGYFDGKFGLSIEKYGEPDEAEIIKAAEVKMILDAKKFSYEGKNVVIDTIFADDFGNYDYFSRNLEGWNIKWVLVYVPIKVLTERIKIRNQRAEEKNKPYEKTFMLSTLEQFVDIYKKQQNSDEIIIDTLLRGDLCVACDLTKKEFPFTRDEQYNEFVKKQERKLGFDNEETESVKITPRLSYDLVVKNIEENDAQKCAEQIKESVDVIKQWEETARDGSTVTFKIYDKVLDSELTEKLRKIWVEATYSSYIVQELEKNQEIDESERLSEKEVKKKIREFCIDNWPEGEGMLDFPKGRGICEAGAYRIIAFKNDEPIGFVFFVNDIVNGDGVVQNILKPNEKW